MKLRLSLSMVAMAVLPLAIAAPLAYSILDGQQVAERLRAERDATALAAAIGTRLDRTEEIVVRSASGAILRGLFSTPPRTNIATARAALLTLAASPNDGVSDVVVQDNGGSVRAWISGGKVAGGDVDLANDAAVLKATLDLEGSSAYQSDVWKDGDQPMLTIAAAIPGSADDPAGIIRVDVSLTQVVSAGAIDLIGPRSLAKIVTAAGAVVAQAKTSATGPPADGTAGTASIPGFADWQIQVIQPRQSPQTPLILLGGLGMVTLAICMLVMWMARQVIRPAEQLEASRSRLGDLYEQAREDALRDGLTGLGNHRAFHEEFDRQLSLAKRHAVPLALVLIDLDDFKLVNDTSGHAAGDELLAEMGRITTSTVRTSDRAFRIGGDEFAILMPHTDAEGARVVGRRLLAVALDTRRNSNVPSSFSFSMGISSAPSLASDRRQLYAQADSALYWAKTHGRTMVEIYDSTRHRSLGMSGGAAELSSSVAEITALRALRPVYQPIVELRSGRVIGYEGLVRPAPESGFTNAGELFAAAEASGRQTELDQTCLDVVVSGAAHLPPETILSLNISPRSLEAPEFSVPNLVSLLERHGITPDRVILELTERETVDDLDRLRHTVAIAREAGLRIAADDVGAGNAGLRLLSQMQFDIVKIDLSLVQGSPRQKTSLAVINSLQELAQRWGAWVIAEGVETAEQLELIRNVGISDAQGYLLGRPGDSLAVSSVDIAALLDPGDWLNRLGRTPAGAPAIPVGLSQVS